MLKQTLLRSWLRTVRSSLDGGPSRPTRRRARPTLEPLEDRTTPALTILFDTSGGAGNFDITFTDDPFFSGNQDIDLVLRFDAATGNLEYSADGAPFSQDLDPSTMAVDSATFADINEINVFLGASSDRLALELSGFAYAASVTPDDAISSETDVDLIDTGTAETVDFDIRGTELIRFDGVDGNDTLLFATGFGDDVARVDNAPTAGDRVTSDILPNVEFNGLALFRYSEAGTGTNRVTFATRNLSGAAIYETDLGDTDTLIIEGSNGLADSFTLTNPAGAVPPVAVTDNLANGGAGLTITQVTTTTVSVQVNGLGGDDTVTVDVDGPVDEDIIANPIGYDGGAGFDTLRVIGTAATGVDEVIYTPGPSVDAGRLRYEDVGNLGIMLIDFVNLEPVIDLVTAARLTVNGTAANNAINYANDVDGATTTGLVTVDAFESIEFANKTNLTINAGAGSDEINLSPTATPIGLTGTIAVNGGDPTGSDKLVLTGSAAAEAFLYAPTDVDGGTLGITGLPSMPFTGIEAVAIDGRSDLTDDTLTVRTEAGVDFVLLLAGLDFDGGTVRIRSELGTDATPPLSFRGLGVGGILSFESDNPNTREDVLEYHGSSVADLFTMTAANGGTIDLNQQVEVRAPGINALILRGLAGDDVFTTAAVHPFAGGLTNDGGGGFDTANLQGGAATLISIEDTDVVVNPAQVGGVVDATAAVSIVRRRVRVLPGRNAVRVRVTLVNNTNQVVQGPLALLLPNIAPAQHLNSSGKSLVFAPGKSFRLVNLGGNNQFQPGQRVRALFLFRSSTPLARLRNLRLRVLAGTGLR